MSFSEFWVIPYQGTVEISLRTLGYFFWLLEKILSGFCGTPSHDFLTTENRSSDFHPYPDTVGIPLRILWKSLSGFKRNLSQDYKALHLRDSPSEFFGSPSKDSEGVHLTIIGSSISGLWEILSHELIPLRIFGNFKNQWESNSILGESHTEFLGVSLSGCRRNPF